MRKTNFDGKGRWRSEVISFRASADEKEEIERSAKLSGLTKQDYYLNRCRQKDIIVIGNPRVYKALRDEMIQILDELEEIKQGKAITDEQLEIIRLIMQMMKGLSKPIGKKSASK